jgi:hypothetical protein
MSNPLTNVAFIVHLKRLRLFPIQPDEQDFDPAAQAHTPDEYRLAQRRKMLRLLEEWKATQPKAPHYA